MEKFCSATELNSYEEKLKLLLYRILYRICIFVKNVKILKVPSYVWFRHQMYNCSRLFKSWLALPWVCIF